MAKKRPQVALVYDFDGTLSPGNMQEFGFIQATGKTKEEFWDRNRKLAEGKDANGILNVSAKDKATGKEQSIRIEASSGLSEDEINRMKAEAEQNAAADKAEREKIDKMNQADSMIFSTENFLKDNGDKIPADKKPGIEQALQQLKDAHKAGDVAAIDSAMNNLNTVMQAASQQMYQGGQQAGPQGAQGGQQAQGGNDGAQDVQDADFEEVK